MRNYFTPSVFKNLFLLVSTVLITSISLKAQTTVTIGTGTGTSTYFPIYYLYDYSYSQTIYSAAELTTGGAASSGMISKIRYKPTANASTVGKWKNWTVFMGNTSQNGYTATSNYIPSSTLTQVFLGDLPDNVTANTWVELTLPTPFLWDGYSNLVVTVLDNTFGWGNTPSWAGYTAAPISGALNRGVYFYQDNTTINPNAPSAASSGVSNSIAQIQFVWTSATPCTGKPNAGTVSANPMTGCVGVPINLTSAGISLNASGIKYQWQVSTNNGATWTSNTKDTFPSLTTTQSTTSQYRIIATCSNSSQADTSNAVTVVSPPIPGGTYTINKGQATTWPTGTNFNSFAAAYASLNCGISAPVIFDVVPGSGPYNEQLIINGKVSGASVVNTITFKGNGETLGFNSSNTNERAVVKIKNTRYFVFDSLVINASGGTYGYGFHLTNDADSNIIKKCTINTSLTATTANYAGIVISGSNTDPIGAGTTLCDANVIDANTINGGMYGITLTATFAGGANGFNKITRNKINDFYTNGIHITASYNTLIEKNIITRPTRTTTATTVNGIIFNDQNNGPILSKNKIYELFKSMPSNTATFNGINFNSSSPSAGNDYVITNNLIAASEGNGVQNGILNSGTNSLQFMNNTISLDNVTSTTTSSITTRGYNQTGSSQGIIFYNNIVSVTRTGTGPKYCVYATSNATVPISDYNDYYISPATNHYIGFNGANRQTFQLWQTSTGQDLTSLNFNPVFSGAPSGDYSPANSAIDNKALPGLVVDDINDVVRSATTPDMGAYEFTAPVCTVPPVAGPTSILPDSTCQNTPVFLNVTLGQYGSGQTFQWQRSNTLNGTYSNIGNPKATPDTTINADTTGYYRCAITCGGVTVYSDSVKLRVRPSLPAGVYTINNALPTSTNVPYKPGDNFNNYNDTKIAMSCGILGAVTFNVQPNSGPYNEQLVLDSVAGTSVVNTVTYNGNGTTIAFSPTNTNERAVIKLNKADYIIFDSLTIDASAGTSFGYGIQLINNADTNIVRKSTIIANTNSTGVNFAGIVINSAAANATTLGNTYCDGNIFENNKIIGGYYGVTVVGSAAVPIEDNQFINNEISDFYTYGIYIAGTNKTLIQKNKIHRPTRSNVSNGYGIYATAAVNNLLSISKNRITNFFGGAPTSTFASYGIYHNNVTAGAGSENLVSNNLIYKLDANAGASASYGIYNTGSGGVNYYFNTIAVDNLSSTSTGLSVGFYQTGIALGVEFKNNLISMTRTGLGQKYAIQLLTTSNNVVTNNNNYHINAPGTLNFVGRYGSVNAATLAAWKTASSSDANSYSEDPIFEDTLNANYKPQALSLDDKGVPAGGITTDIVEATRNVTTPDIGAYEFAPGPCPIPMTAGTATITPNTGMCLESPIRLNLTGHSPLGSVTFQWQNSATGTPGSWFNVGQVQFVPQFDTLSSVNSYYRCIIMCTGGNSDTSLAVQVNLNAILPAGSYTIDGTQPTNWPVPNPGPNANFNTFQEAVTALQCGLQGHVVFNVKPGVYNEQIRIPYIPGTSATNATVTFQSENGNPASAELTYNASSALGNYTLKLDSAQYVFFKKLTISATGTTFGRVVEFANTASNDSLVNCVINAPVVNNTSTNFTAVTATTLKGSNIVVKGNTINNGSSGIYFTGTSTVNKTFNHLIDSNIISGMFHYGIYVNYTSKLTLSRNNITVAAPVFSTSHGIYMGGSDSMYQIVSNKILIKNTVGSTYGIWVTGSGGSQFNDVKVMGNDIVGGSGNTSIFYGIRITNSPFIYIANNTVASNTTSTCYGIHIDNSSDGKYYNNSINTRATSLTNGYGLYVLNSSATGIDIKNNIIANNGGGKAMFVTNPAGISSNYNMLYTTGTVLVQKGSPAATYPNLLTWFNASMQDRYSMGYKPAFINDSVLLPNLNNDSVWAMHGRGTQIQGNNEDHDGNARPTTLIAGVPDLGAYEFYPNVAPTILSAVPATPAPNTTQTFYYGTDTVMRITWKANAPASIELQRYSGVVPQGLAAANLDSMYFYVQSTIPGGGNYDYDAKLYYLDPWLGSIQSPSQLGIGRTSPSNAWIVGVDSRNEMAKRMLYDKNANYLDKFTGLFNPYAPPVIPDRDSSNTGKRFWVGYGHHQQMTTGGGSMDMVLYLSALDEPANVQVKIKGFVRNYLIPSNTAIQTDLMPKTGADDSRLTDEGLFDRGISIISDAPINAYAHIYSVTNSGATMLMPIGVWGYEYVALGSAQYYSSDCYSWFYVVADRDSTVVEITPSQVTKGGHPAGVPFTVTLNEGDVYQVMGTTSGSAGTDLTGSLVKSVYNTAGKCNPIAVFSGSSRTAICNTTNGDNIIQQIFPSTAWGKRYLTFGTANSLSNTAYNSTKWRILVKDPATQVMRNGILIPQAQLITPGNYYEIQNTNGTGASTANYIEANQPVLVSQYMVSQGGSGCPGLAAPTGNTDPEMFYISPIEQGIKKVVVYNTSNNTITANYINVIVPTAGLSSFKIDNNTGPFTDMFPHPYLAGYTCIRQNIPVTSGQHTIECDSAFTAITYGLGSAESYGYNAGTLVKSLRATGSGAPSSTSGTINPPAYTCSGTSTTIIVRIATIPTSMTWKFSNVPNVTPNADVTVNNPTPTDSAYDSNGDRVYFFTLPQSYTFSTPGLYTLPVTFTAPTIGSCDNSQTDIIYVHVIPSPAIGFSYTFAGCEGNTANFNADPSTPGGVNANSWAWTFHDATTANGQTASYTYNTAGTFPIKLDVVTADGCVGDSTKTITVNPLPTVSVTNDVQQVCAGSNVTFDVATPATGVDYNWFDSPTSTTILFTGSSYTLNNVTTTQDLYIEAVNTVTGCISATRKKVTVTVFNLLTAPVATVSNVTQSSVTFSWAAVPGASSYQVSTDNGTTWVTPSSGSTGLTHTVSGLAPSTSVTLIVRALGTLDCQKNTSAPVTGTSLAVYQVYVPNAFNPSSSNPENRTFKIYGSIKNMSLMVFNQWGQKVYESNTPTPGWDGTFKGKPLPSGVYIYVLKYTLIDDKTGEQKGSLNLIR